MIVETGHFALVLALVVAAAQGLLPLAGLAVRHPGLQQTAAPAAHVQFVFVALAFAALTYAYVVSDFSVLNVVENSHSDKPMLYKITGVWGNHEGSLLLWVLILAGFGSLAALAGNHMPQNLRAAVLGVQGLIAAAFLLFMLASSNPFLRMADPPMEGRDLNPILQDIGLAIHPPLLYVGYVGFSIAFSFAAGALIVGRIDQGLARWMRPWVLVAWSFLTLGIAMGSYWAYYELGWGGFWFWDPVENASLMPWLAGTALLHSVIVMEKRDALKIWTIFLAILAFSLSLLGTFLVRSGVLTSVHTFATDPARGFFILCILIAFIGGALALFAWRAPLLKQGGLFAPVSREGALVLNNLLLSACTVTVFVGTLYPLALESITGEKISVGPPFFNLTFGPLFLALMVALPFGQSLAWKRGDLYAVTQRLIFAAVAGVAVAAAVYAFSTGISILPVLGVWLSVFVILGAFVEIGPRIWRPGMPIATAWSRAIGLPLSAWGAALAHAGLGVSLLGLAATGWGVERIVSIKPGETVTVSRFSVTLEGLAAERGPNFEQAVAVLRLREGGRIVGEARPARRLYTARQMPTTEAGIVTVGFGQFYATMAEQSAGGAADLRLYWKPLVTLLWIGSLIMAAGGALSVADRRLRIAAGRRAPSAHMAPAE